MDIQVLGSGCTTCHNLFDLTKQAVEELGLKTEVTYVTGDEGIRKIIELGASSSPVLAINGSVASMGYVPDVHKVKEIIAQYLK